MPRLARALLRAAALALVPAVAALAPAGALAQTAPMFAAPPAGVQDRTAALVDALHLPEIFDIMEQEGATYGAEIADQMFEKGDTASWDREVARIYDSARTFPLFRDRFAEALADVPEADIAAMLDFLGSERGARIIALEVSARRAFLDPAVEETSLLRLEEMREMRDPRLGRIEDLIAAGDLIEENVSSAMNANLAFYRGMAEGGALDGAMTDEDMLSDVWSQEDQIRTETSRWVMSMLTLAYAPLDDADLEAYRAFSESAAGRRLNRAMFQAFDAVFSDVSFRLGLAAAGVLAGQDL